MCIGACVTVFFVHLPDLVSWLPDLVSRLASASLITNPSQLEPINVCG